MRTAEQLCAGAIAMAWAISLNSALKQTAAWVLGLLAPQLELEWLTKSKAWKVGSGKGVHDLLPVGIYMLLVCAVCGFISIHLEERAAEEKITAAATAKLQASVDVGLTAKIFARKLKQKVVLSKAQSAQCVTTDKANGSSGEVRLEGAVDTDSAALQAAHIENKRISTVRLVLFHELLDYVTVALSFLSGKAAYAFAETIGNLLETFVVSFLKKSFAINPAGNATLRGYVDIVIDAAFAVFLTALALRTAALLHDGTPRKTKEAISESPAAKKKRRKKRKRK